VAQDQLLTEDEVIAALPPWTTQITARSLSVGLILGAVFSFITMRFSLGPGGVVPTFNMPIGMPTTKMQLGMFLGLQCLPLSLPFYGIRCIRHVN
jgi:hypothetical protein